MTDKERTRTTTTEEKSLIMDCVMRYIVLEGHDLIPNEIPDEELTGLVVELCMVLDVTHTEIIPLNLKNLLDFSDSDLIHDIVGLRDNIDVETGEMIRKFTPLSAMLS